MAREYTTHTLMSTTLTVGDAPMTGAVIPCGGFKTGTFFLNVSAIKLGGTANLDVVVYTYDPASGSPVQLFAFTQTAIVGTEKKVITNNLGYKIDADATISGGAAGDTITFTVGAVLKS